jgi:hypothetical protein
MMLLRYLYFTVTTFKVKPSSLVYMSPRGLISILLFIQLKEVSFIDLTNSPIDERVLLIVILSSMLIMLIGTLKKSKSIELDNDTEEEVPLTVEMKVENSDSTENEAEDPLN